MDAGINASFGIIGRLCDGIYLTHDVGYYHGLVKQEFMGNNNQFQTRNIYLSAGFLINNDAVKKWKNKMHQHNNSSNGWRKKRRIYKD